MREEGGWKASIRGEEGDAAARGEEDDEMCVAPLVLQSSILKGKQTALWIKSCEPPSPHFLSPNLFFLHNLHPSVGQMFCC